MLENQWICTNELSLSDFLFPNSRKSGHHICYHYYANIVKNWVSKLGLVIAQYDTHSLSHIKASLIYALTKNLRAIQLLLGHSKLQNAGNNYTFIR
ncbi:tyrosine-type recombinase/integrase [Thalassotalea hakodatensis]|uniref:tyrosine-type recombinase/integrase n=1 Tax=Thalassotalea hakodatensis TaxID=3030492 RepID=UPI00389A2ABB